MNALLFILINGFLFSVSSSSVTTNTSTNQLPVVQEDCRDEKPVPFVQPQKQQQSMPADTGHQGVKQTSPKQCADENAC